jgi:hypothetical protein
MTSRTDPSQGQRCKGRGTPLAAVSFPRVLAVVGGLAAGRAEEQRRQGRSTAAEIAWHPPAALTLDGSASSHELCAGTSSAGRAQARKDGGRGGLARTEPVEYSSAHPRRPSCEKKVVGL